MASGLFSRFRDSTNTAASIYETIRQHDEDQDESDIEERAGLGHNSESSPDGFRNVNIHSSRNASQSGTLSHSHTQRLRSSAGLPSKSSRVRAKWAQRREPLLDVEEADDDVPASLLIEGPDGVGGEQTKITLPPPPSVLPDQNPIGPSSSRQLQDQWQMYRGRQTLLRNEARRADNAAGLARSALTNLAMAAPKEKAMWRWANVENLDNFLFDVYDYYLNHGFWSIILRRVFNLITVAFVVGFSLFLTQCIDYRLVKGSTRLNQILVPQCAMKMGFVPNVLLWVTTFVWISKVFQYVMDIRRLRNLHDFFLHLLDLPEDEVQSISWQEVVSRLMALRDSNPNIATSVSDRTRRYVGTQNKQRMDAHDIANRLMRKENYFIAMINKDILDMTLPIPFLRNRQLFTRNLEWNINQCIMDYVFNSQGQIRTLFLKDTHRKALSEGLRRRFIFAGTANLIIAPFLIGFFLIQNFFQYFNEYQKNPAQIGSRQYNPLAEWKFREFNELWHLFQRRINMSHPFASRYIDQFPKDKTVQTARFVTFVSGALVSVLGLATILDQESFLGFEITSGRTTIFYIGLFGTVWAVARGLLPDDNLVYEPAFCMQEVIEFTHYQPSHWTGRLHTMDVKLEFAQLYQMKIAIFMEEVLSMIFTPFVLWFSLPKCSDKIIDFFREFTVHVDGIGYVCSFAEFKFQKPGAIQMPSAAADNTGIRNGQNPREVYYSSKDQKLEQSYWGFMNDYARNPKADVRFQYSSARRKFTLPPPLPGLPSPSLHGMTDHSVIGTQDRSGIAWSPQRGTPGFMAPPSNSPLQSLLLDPHHQPSASGFLSSPNFPKSQRPTSNRQRRPEREPSDVQEADDIKSQAVQDPDIDRNAGELGSWKYEEDSDDTSDQEDVNRVTGDGAGVLGLIKQFQKAQGEGNRAGIAL